MRNRKSACACWYVTVSTCAFPFPYSLPRVHTRQMKHVQSKTYIHLSQRRAKVLAIVCMNEEEDGGGRKSGGAGTVDILAAKIGMVARARAVKPNGVVNIDYKAKVHEAEGKKEGEVEGGRTDWRVAHFGTQDPAVGGKWDVTYPSKPMTQPYQNVSAQRTRFTSNLPFSTGGFCITSGSAFSQARPRACREGRKRE